MGAIAADEQYLKNKKTSINTEGVPKTVAWFSNLSLGQKFGFGAGLVVLIIGSRAAYNYFRKNKKK